MINKVLVYRTGNSSQYPGWGVGRGKRRMATVAVAVALNMITETARLKIQQSGAIENNSL